MNLQGQPVLFESQRVHSIYQYQVVKSFFLLSFLLPIYLCNAQRLEFKKVVELPGLKAHEIIDLSNRWAIKAYGNYPAVFQYKDSTMLVLKGGISVYTGINRTFYKYRLQVDAKEGRCRIVVTDFKTYSESSNSDVWLFTRESAIDSVSKQTKQSERWRRRQIEKFNHLYDQIESETNGLMEVVQKTLITSADEDEW
jgi:hypothetical protein